LLKSISSKLKSFFSGKKKENNTVKPAPKKVVEKKHNSPKGERFLHDKATDKKPYPKKKRRKETPEEYRARHERRKQEQNAKQSEKAEVPKVEWDPSKFKVDIVDGKTRFHDFDIAPEVMQGIFEHGFEYCTPVQSETLQKSLIGQDVTAQAQTGTGKTAAFLITIFNHFVKKPIEKKRRYGTPRALILAPTRELVLQIEKDARALGKYVDCSIQSILGGMEYQKQQNILKSSESDILICTPGRLIDFQQKRIIDLGKVEILVIDEADRMLDMGFIPDVKKIVVSTPQKSKRQTMFFTATMSGDVERLSYSWTKQAHNVNIEPEEIAAKNVEQITYITTIDEKPTLLYNIITKNNLERVLIFSNRKDEAKKLKYTFDTYGISCALLSGDVEQKQRIRRLENFREGKIRVLIATDVASRGLHVDDISHVINYNLPQDPEDYVHRIGRTGRAGASGISINFADEESGHEMTRLEEYLEKKIECVFPDDDLLVPIPPENIKTVKPESEKKKRYSSRGKKYPANKKHFNKKKPE
jgi:ATP-dependent RNA helicase RhlB